jgi:hypothetical protein
MTRNSAQRTMHFGIGRLLFLLDDAIMIDDGRQIIDRYKSGGLRWLTFSMTFSKYLRIRHGCAWDLFRFFIQDKYLRIRHGCAWDLNSLLLFSHLS